MYIKAIRKCSGLSIIELILAMLLLSVGFVSISTMINSLLKHSQQSIDVRQNLELAKTFINIISDIPVAYSKDCKSSLTLEYVCNGENILSKSQLSSLVKSYDLSLPNDIANYQVRVNTTDYLTKQANKLVLYEVNITYLNLAPVTLATVKSK